MRPSDLTSESFVHYPPAARALAVGNLSLLQQLPLVFAALLLRETNGYDWRFPVERRILDDQFSYLNGLAPAKRIEVLQGFAALAVPLEIVKMDWVSSPQKFLDALTANLWSAQQIGEFREIAAAYVENWQKNKPEPQPIVPRCCIVCLDKDLHSDGIELFRKLRRYGVFFPSIAPTDAWESALAFTNSRAEKNPLAYGHWYIDGGAPDLHASSHLTRTSWDELESMRASVLARIRRVVESGHGGPEQAATLMGETAPADLGGLTTVPDEVLTRFQVSVLTGGSGAQVFSTTFVQWAAREALRRAQPCTLLMRYRPRQGQLPMNELIEDSGKGRVGDFAGSLIDADMGAFYTWINQQRLTGADRSAFVAWSEAHNQAVAIGPGMPQATTSPTTPTLIQILNSLT